MTNLMKISPDAVSEKGVMVKKYKIKRAGQPTVIVQPHIRKGGIRRNGPVSLNPYKESMRVSVVDSFKGIQEMNDKALKIIAKRM